MIPVLSEIDGLVRFGWAMRGLPGAIRRRIRPRFGDRYSPTVSRHLRVAPALFVLLIAVFAFAVNMSHSATPAWAEHAVLGALMLILAGLMTSLIVLMHALPEESRRRPAAQSVRYDRGASR
ncbi:hypothetical protein [Longimicrobium terrae]|uniref:Uncharacterized protein n=1 Tax=Longimicrobium terrae TaxID=1639882 RepID=A0A841GMQ8_9BACT|nr:hypothetical protein [Longimicrobium terrae]MBB4635687.1 hypothetical protein [Longimicrobium terrae]MBB6070081.1 hypothetical protein [Longimicrobium terrae]NNC32984.1 hypothetical protein [Longimicrobium terrae]